MKPADSRVGDLVQFRAVDESQRIVDNIHHFKSGYGIVIGHRKHGMPVVWSPEMGIVHPVFFEIVSKL